MKLVIDIPEEVYTFIRNVWKDVESDKRSPFCELCKAVENGKPLPKGHGRLIDGDSLKNCFHYGEANTNNENNMIMAVRRIIESAPTVIEADKEGAE